MLIGGQRGGRDGQPWLPDLRGQFDRLGQKTDLHLKTGGAGQMREIYIFSLRGATYKVMRLPLGASRGLGTLGRS